MIRSISQAKGRSVFYAVPGNRRGLYLVYPPEIRFRMLRQFESTPYLQKMQIRLFLCRKICTNSFSIFHGSVLPWQMLHILVVKNLVRF